MLSTPIDRLLARIWETPFTMLRITADVEVPRVHYLDAAATGKAKALPPGFSRRQSDYVFRRLDLEVCRLLGIYPGSVLPAYHAFCTLFERARSLDGLCRTDSHTHEAWPECPHARQGYYEQIAAAPGASLREQTLQGETLEGTGIWALFRPRRRQDMATAKARSAQFILEKAERLFLRPQHCLCILCQRQAENPLVEDNLVELRRRMEQHPNIPVTLCEGCCMVCDPCNVYDPESNICYHADPKNYLRDLMLLERLDLAPGATLPARELFQRIYERIGHLKEICGWRDGSNSCSMWRPCGGYDQPLMDRVREDRTLL